MGCCKQARGHTQRFRDLEVYSMALWTRRALQAGDMGWDGRTAARGEEVSHIGVSVHDSKELNLILWVR